MGADPAALEEACLLYTSYVDVLRCLMFGDAMICQDPIYFANNGVALELCGSEVDLRLSIIHIYSGPAGRLRHRLQRWHVLAGRVEAAVHCPRCGGGPGCAFAGRGHGKSGR